MKDLYHLTEIFLLLFAMQYSNLFQKLIYPAFDKKNIFDSIGHGKE